MKRTIKLSQIANEALDYTTEVPALDPADCRRLVICEQCGSSYGIVDGFHRTAGMVRWAKENGLVDADVVVIVCDDEDLISAAAEPGPGQAAAIKAIYAATK